MKQFLNILLPSAALLCIVASCAPTKVLQTWKDPGYSGPLSKVMIISVARERYIREQFENVLSLQLENKGVTAVPSYTVLPESPRELDRDTVAARVREMGINSVLVALPVNKEESTATQYTMFFSPSAAYSDGWYRYYTGSVVYSQRDYKTDFYTVSTKIFDVASNKPVWGFLSEVKVTGSRQKAVNEFIPEIIQQLSEQGLLPK